MLIFKSKDALQHHLSHVRQNDATVGFVPTMGALHEGHASLIKYSVQQQNHTVVSIYVNPTQFNDATDLEKYPRPVIQDLEKLESLNVDVAFLPTDAEIYPQGKHVVPEIDLGHLGRILEAAFRPGHFEGVVQVMDRLLRIVQSDYLYMGRKDLQQIAVVQKLIASAGFHCELIGLPIIREPHGLAMSSRNERLSDEDRIQAGIIFQVLSETAREYSNRSYDQLRKLALDRLSKSPFRPEYFEFIRNDTFVVLDAKPEDGAGVSAVTAVWCGDVRLIDNMEM